MALTSLEFAVFVFAAAVLYYTVFARYQWIFLLFVSYVYYMASGTKNIVFLAAVTVVTYTAGILMNKTEGKRRRKKILVLALILDFSILAVLKYTNFFISSINEIFFRNSSDGSISLFNLILPLGISFFTFQSAGYMLDVYWKRSNAEKNFFRYALFVAWFPQIMQGPIGRFERLSEQFFQKHIFSFKHAERALQLILYGMFKKMVLADNAALLVDKIFHQYEIFDGMVILGVLAYSAQLYGDFSGGIDVVRGVSALFHVTLDENFRQPYFAKSITDFWHRWHITLGTWMKDYVFYPVSLSKWMGKLKKYTKQIFGKKMGRTIPICIANILVFLLVGIWHGPAWKFVVYGLYNGLIIGFSGLMAEHYAKARKICSIQENSRGFQFFQIIRTFILVNISWLFDMADTVGQAVQMFWNMFTRFDISPLLNGSIYADKPSLVSYRYIQISAIFIGCVVVFVISVLKERGTDVGEKLLSLAFPVKTMIYLAAVFSLPMFGMPPNMTGGFIYAQF